MADLRHIGGAIAEVRGGIQWRRLFLEAAERKRLVMASPPGRMGRYANDELPVLRGILDCTHEGEQSRTVRKNTAAGIRLYQECRKCQRTFGNAIALNSVPDIKKVPMHNEAKTAEFLDSVKRQLDQTFARSRESWDARIEQANDEWWELYNDYLSSPAWSAIRSKVIERAHNRCEGCRAAGIEHVHHLTYDRVGWELLFDLVALCRNCHDRAHGRIE